MPRGRKRPRQLLQTPQKIRTARDEEDWAALERYAHTLKGGAGSLRINTVRSTAQTLEATIEDRGHGEGRNAPPPEMVNKLIDAVEEALVAIRALG